MAASRASSELFGTAPAFDQPIRLGEGTAMVTRREFIAASSAIAAAGALTGNTADAAGPRGTSEVRGPFRHGVASGDPLEDRVILWTRITPKRPRPVAVRWVIAEDERLRQVVNQGVVTALPDRDFTVKVDADGLQAGRTYWYRFEAEGTRSETGRTRSLPAQDARQVRFAVVSCSNLPFGYFNAYARIAERDALDAVLHLGDYLYEYAPAEYGNGSEFGRMHTPARELVSLSDYRERHAQYRSDPDLQAAHRQHPWICVWDDHESANNSWRDGAQNHQPEQGEGEWATRKAAAIRAYHEWLPIRERPGAGGPQIWRSFRFGPIADLIMLDTRLHGRSQQVADRQDGVAIAAPGRTMLGPDQHAWLAEELRASVRRGSAWHVIGQQLMFGQLIGDDGILLNTDQWDGYPASRRQVLDQLAAEGIDDTVILTGDIHSAWAMDIAIDPLGGDYDGSTGRGSLAVELVTTSVTSPGPRGAAPDLEARERQIVAERPHIHYVNLREHGYLLVDLTAERAQAEWWLVDSITERSPGERRGAAFITLRGANHLQPVEA
jgi:alkaline phosphatase D